MASFRFRLQKVLEFRAKLEAESKRTFLAKRSEVVAIENEIAQTRARRLEALTRPRASLDDYLLLEADLIRLDDVERQQNVVLSVLNDEAEALRLAWTRHKQELEAIVKLREKAHDEWMHAETRREQAELDEWAVLRRAA